MVRVSQAQGGTPRGSRPVTRGRGRRRLRRGPLLLPVLAAAALVLVVGTVISTRPTVATVLPVALPDAHVGTAYAFDGVVCLAAPRGATVSGIEVRQAPGTTTRLALPPADARPTIAFPVPPDALGDELADYPVEAGVEDCELRLLVTPDEQGELRAGDVRVRYRWGPGGLLRRTAEIRPAVTLQVTQTGRDPRLDLR